MEITMQEKILCSINEATKILGIGRTKLYELLNLGTLSSVRIGTRRLVKFESIKAVLDQSTVGAA